MIEQISAFFTVEMIYMWLNIGVIPFLLMLIIFPQTKVCGLFVTSIIPTFILASVYVYLLYIFFFAGYDFDKNRGYGTKTHLEGLENYGITPIHRKTFEPIKSKVKY